MQAPSGIAPEMFDAKFECLVIGVRNMEAFNLLDIGNPIVEMDSGNIGLHYSRLVTAGALQRL